MPRLASRSHAACPAFHSPSPLESGKQLDHGGQLAAVDPRLFGLLGASEWPSRAARTLLLGRAMQSKPPGGNSAVRPFTIVVASDFEPASGYAFDLALQMALRIPRSHLDVVHVVGRSTDDGRLHRLSRLLGLYVEERFTADSYWGQSAGIHVRRGDKARELAQFASEVSADVILLGPRTHRHLRDLMHASLADQLQSKVRCPVLRAQQKQEPPPREPVVEPAQVVCEGSGVRVLRRDLPRIR